MWTRLRSVLRALLRRRRLRGGHERGAALPPRATRDDLVRSGVPAGRSGAPCAHGARQRRQREGRLPPGARAAPVRRAPAATCATPCAGCARRPGSPPPRWPRSRSAWRQPRDLRRRRRGPAPAAAVSRRRTGWSALQHLSARPACWTTAARCTNYYERRGRIAALRGAGRLPRVTRPSSARRARPNGGRSRGCHRSSSRRSGSARCMGRAFTEAETTYADRRRGHPDRRATGGSASTAIPHVIGRTLRVDGLRETGGRRAAARLRFLSSTARLFFPLSSSPESAGRGERHSGSGAADDRAAAAGRDASRRRRRRSTRTTPPSEADDPDGAR